MIIDTHTATTTNAERTFNSQISGIDKLYRTKSKRFESNSGQSGTCDQAHSGFCESGCMIYINPLFIEFLLFLG